MLKIGRHCFDGWRLPLIMGVLNVTPDSFSDGGRFLDPEVALSHALQMESDGADFIDIGAESSRPGAVMLDAEAECARLLPALQLLMKSLKIPVSVDTSKYEVMRRSLDAGASAINDIRAMSADSRIPVLLAERGASVVLMHMRGEPSVMQRDTVYTDLPGEVCAFLAEAAKKAIDAGIERERIIVDPGIGFGKSVDGNFELLRNIGQLRDQLGYPVAVGLSKKSFMQKAANRNAGELAVPMAAMHALVMQQGVEILRVHDIIDAKLTRDTIGCFMGKGSACR